MLLYQVLYDLRARLYQGANKKELQRLFAIALLDWPYVVLGFVFLLAAAGQITAFLSSPQYKLYRARCFLPLISPVVGIAH